MKIHGNRAEIPEIEIALLDWDHVREAAVEAKEVHGALRLVAFVVPEKQPMEPLDEASVSGHLGERLPAYMVPTHVHMLDALPLLPKGKVARDQLKELRDGEASAAPIANPVQATDSPSPVNDDQATLDPEPILRLIWKRVFDRQNITADDNLFELGADSLMMMDLMVSLDREFGRHAHRNWAKAFM